MLKTLLSWAAGVPYCHEHRINKHPEGRLADGISTSAGTQVWAAGFIFGPLATWLAT